MSRSPPSPFQQAALGHVQYAGEEYPGVHAYYVKQAMGRVRAYQSAGLSPFAGRGAPQERLLIGHVHVDEKGRVTAIEGFNGGDGQRFVEHAAKVLADLGLLVSGASVEPTKGLRLCQYTGY